MLAPSHSFSRKRRRLRAGAVGLLALLMVLGGGVTLYLRSSLPQTSGRLVVPSLRAEIRIDRDAGGVPLITAPPRRGRRLRPRLCPCPGAPLPDGAAAPLWCGTARRDLRAGGGGNGPANARPRPLSRRPGRDPG